MENIQAFCRCITIFSCVINLLNLGPHIIFNFFVTFSFFFPQPQLQRALEVEESNEDIPDLMDPAGEEFECLDSDFEDGDGELEFLDSFV